MLRPGMAFLQFYKKDAAAASFMSVQLFKMLIPESLLRQRKATRGRPPRSSIDATHSAKVKKGPPKPMPNRSIRTDGYKHWPEFRETKGRCQNPGCKTKNVQPMGLTMCKNHSRNGTMSMKKKKKDGTCLKCQFNIQESYNV